MGKITIEADGAKIKLKEKEIFMKKPKVKDLKNVDHVKSDEDREIELFANLTQIPKDELEEFYLDEYSLLQEAYLKLTTNA